MIALIVPPPIALVLGYLIWGLLLWFVYGDSPTHPPNIDGVVQWLTAAYIAVGVLWGLGIHAIVIRKPWFFLAGLAVTIGLICGVIWAYVNLYEPFLALYAFAP